MKLTTHLSTPWGWKAELALLADLQRTVYPYKWLPISCRSVADQWKFAGQRPTFYHRATQPTKQWRMICSCCFTKEHTKHVDINSLMEYKRDIFEKKIIQTILQFYKIRFKFSRINEQNLSTSELTEFSFKITNENTWQTGCRRIDSVPTGPQSWCHAGHTEQTYLIQKQI